MSTYLRVRGARGVPQDLELIASTAMQSVSGAHAPSVLLLKNSKCGARAKIRAVVSCRMSGLPSFTETHGVVSCQFHVAAKN
jgi:hypothetical protein